MNKKQIALGVASAFGAAAAQAVVLDMTLVGAVTEGNMGPSSAIVSTSTATWTYDTVTDVLTATGLYRPQYQIVPTPGQLFTHNIVNLVVGGGAAAAASAYACVEGTFGSGVGASLCGNYNFGGNATNESSTTWGPGTAFSRTLGGDDGIVGAQQDLSQRDGMSSSNVCGSTCTADGSFDGNVLVMSNAMSAVSGYAITLRQADWAVDDDMDGMGDPFYVLPSATLNIDVLANDLPSTDNITALSIDTPPPAGSAAVVGTPPDDRANLSIDYTAPPGFSTMETFVYQVNDDLGVADTATVTVVADLIPDAVDDNANTGGSPITIDVLANDSLGNAPDNTVEVISGPTQGSVSNPGPNTCTSQVDPNCQFNYDPMGATGVASFTYELTDENGSTDTATVSITIGTGISATPDDVTTEIDTPISIDVLANDANLDNPDFVVDELVAPTGGTVDNAPQTCTIPANCALDYTPPLGTPGEFTFDYEVTDADGLGVSSSATVTVFVNDVPVANDDSSFGPGFELPAEIPTATTTGLDVQANDTGLNDTPIIVNITTPPNDGMAVFNVGTGEVDYTSDPGFVGTDTFQYTLTDNRGVSAPDTSAAATVTVNVDDEPTAVDDGAPMAPAFTVNEGTALDLDVLANDTGLSDTPLTVSITTPATRGTASPVNSPGDPADVRVNYLAGNDPGFDSFVYQITDQSGDVSSATAYVAVVDVDFPMAMTDSDTTITNEPVTTDVTANDAGLADQPLTVTITQQPVNGTAVAQACAGLTCNVTYTPGEGYSGGRDTYQYTVKDEDGDVSNVADVNIRVNPIAVDDDVTAFIDTPADTNVLANDLRLMDTPLSVTIETGPMNGDITGVQGCDQQGTCIVTYTPDPGFTGTDSYKYSFTNSSMEDSNVGTVSLTVNEVPVAADDEAEATAFIPTDIDVLANDDGLSFTPLTVEISSAPITGMASVNGDNTISYTADVDEQFTDQFEYTVTDNNGQMATATVNVSVSGSGGVVPPQETVPGNKSSLAFGPASILALFGLPLLRRLRRRRND